MFFLLQIKSLLCLFTDLLDVGAGVYSTVIEALFAGIVRWSRSCEFLIVIRPAFYHLVGICNQNCSIQDLGEDFQSWYVTLLGDEIMLGPLRRPLVSLWSFADVVWHLCGIVPPDCFAWFMPFDGQGMLWWWRSCILPCCMDHSWLLYSL